MKRMINFFACLAFVSICEGQILKDTLYMATPAQREMYRNAISKGRGQKAVGSLIILGGAAVTTLGAGIAIKGLLTSADSDDYIYDEDDTGRLLWKGGSLIFLLGVGTVGAGVDMIKEGRENVRTGKVCFKISSTSVGLVVNF